MSIKTIAKTVGGFVSSNSPTILTGLSVAGLISTVVMAVRATPEALIILDNEERKREKIKDHPVTNVYGTKEIIKLTWKCYLPATIMGAATVGCIIGANSINLRRNAALAGAYSLTETALKEYKAKVVEKIGESKAREIKDEIGKDKIDRNPVSKNEVIVTGSGETLCYDALSGRYFKSDMETIKGALNKLSRRLMSENFISVNEVYYELGLEGTKMGDVMGWHIDLVDSDLIKPAFSSQLADDGRPCLVLDFDTDPSPYDLKC